MKSRKTFISVCLLLLSISVSQNIVLGQEVNAKVTVGYAQIGSTVDKKVFQNIHKAATTVKKLLNKLKLAAPILPNLEPKKKRIKAFIIGKYKTNKYILFYPFI